jgi:thiamine kinase-like enzyme
LTLLSTALDQLSAMLGPLEGEPTSLAGGITNRNYRACFGGTEVVIRMPGKDTAQLGIDRAAERAANECAARVGVAPEVIAALPDPPCLVTRFVVGRELGPEELREPAALAEVAGALRAVHRCGERVAVSFSAFRIVETYAERARARGVEPPPDYAAARAVAARIEAALGAADEPQPAGERDRGAIPSRGAVDESVLCHNDLLAANFLGVDSGAGADPGAGIRLIDWEYAAMGDPYFDLGNFAVNNGLNAAEEEAFLAAYLGEAPGAHRLARLRAMRVMSDFREAMWAVLQGSLSDLEFDFGAYARTHFDRLAAAAAGPGFEALLEDARAAG